MHFSLKSMRQWGLSLLFMILVSACAAPLGPSAVKPASSANAEDAEKFVAEAERRRTEFGLRANRVSWINATYITDDTDTMAAESANEGLTLTDELARGVSMAQRSSRRLRAN